MRKLFQAICCIVALHFSITVQAAGLSADDFLPPVQASTPEQQKAAETIQQPEDVKDTTGFGGNQAVGAATAQDAVNAAIDKIEEGGGCVQIKFPSGFGWVATGVGTYGAMPNPTATLIAQRQAYQIAYMKAKKSLAEALHGLSTKAKDELADEIKTITNSSQTLSNLNELSTESITEQIAGLLRGYVTYSINDKQADGAGTVTVAIVTTPKTLGKNQRMGKDGFSSDSVRDGLSQVLADLQKGLLAPVGGKVITVPTTGELAFVGFGSAIVPDNPNPAAKTKLKINAQKVAQMRAKSALCGIIIGDDINASTSLDNDTLTLSNQFTETSADDPTSESNPAGIQKLEKQRNDFANMEATREMITSVRNGTLPPGVSVKTFMHPEGTMAEAVAVYMPSMTNQTAGFAKEMQNSKILQDVKPTQQSSAETTGKAGGQGQQSKMPSQGPSGQVMDDSNL